VVHAVVYFNYLYTLNNIPFCKQACHYCNFHFSTSLKYKDEMVRAIGKEIELQQGYLDSKELKSIYFGGGTPSLLSGADLDYLFEKIAQHYTIAPDAEITLEANPDDLTTERLQTLRDSPVNRLSIGVQSFFEEDLTFMNRAHNAEEAVRCIKEAKYFGFDNMTVDLIYGSPTTSHAHWQKNVEQVLAFDIPHISCYCLTVEPNTALEHFVKKGKTEPVDEAHAAEQFEMLVAMLTAAGYEHYEISNFAKPDQHAKHNSNYWLGEQYLPISQSPRC